MASVLTITLSVDFAGSLAEREAFIKEHSSKFPNGLTDGGGGGRTFISPSGCYMLYTKTRSNHERREAKAAFAFLGWEEGSVLDGCEFMKKRA